VINEKLTKKFVNKELSPFVKKLTQRGFAYLLYLIRQDIVLPVIEHFESLYDLEVPQIIFNGYNDLRACAYGMSIDFERSYQKMLACRILIESKMNEGDERLNKLPVEDSEIPAGTHLIGFIDSMIAANVGLAANERVDDTRLEVINRDLTYFFKLYCHSLQERKDYKKVAEQETKKQFLQWAAIITNKNIEGCFIHDKTK
jgi:hypothetical protein